MEASWQEALIDLTNSVTALQERIQGRLDDPDVFREARATWQRLQSIQSGLNQLLNNPSLDRPELAIENRAQFHRFAEAVLVMESYIVPQLVNFNETDRRLTRLVRSMSQQINWPGRFTPIVRADSEQYFMTMPGFNLMRLPARASREILSLPDVIHEMTHILLVDPRQKATLIGDFEKFMGTHFVNQSGPMRVPSSVIDTWREGWLDEFAGDMVATFVSGTPFGDQHIRMMREMNMPAYQHGKTHPANDARMRGTIAVLRAMGRTQDADYIAQQWTTFRQSLGEKKAAGYDLIVPDALIDGLAQRVVEGCKQLGIRSYDLATPAAGDVVTMVSEAWNRFHSDPRGYSVWQNATLANLWQSLDGSTPAVPVTSPVRPQPQVELAA